MFLEERISTCIDYGSAFSESFAVQEVSTANGNSHRSMRHPYPTLRFDLGYSNRLTDEQIDLVLDLYKRVGGRFGGFRLKHHAEFTTNNYRDAPAFNDQIAVLVSPGVYQITRWYGTQGDSATPRRRIRKPVVGTVLVGIRNTTTGDHPIMAFSVDTTTGLITLSANKTDAIAGITQAAQAVVDVGSNTFLVGESVFISGVVGMTQINNRRATVTAKPDSTHITVNINSTAFSAYVSGGTVNTQPQTGESVVAGCEFDIPVRFESDLDGVNYSNLDTLSSAISLIEWLNPS
jgi:uncharacterized protein (TIGR02217 family)